MTTGFNRRNLVLNSVLRSLGQTFHTEGMLPLHYQCSKNNLYGLIISKSLHCLRNVRVVLLICKSNTIAIDNLLCLSVNIHMATLNVQIMF